MSEEKRCAKCGETKPIAEFRAAADRCKACHSKYMREWRAKNLDATRKSVSASTFKHKRGISIEERDAMRTAQDGRCALCNGTLAPGGRGGVVDHDHSHHLDPQRSCRECIRGILCPTCNSLIGHLEAHPERLHPAIEYLRRWQSPAADRLP